eukprot:3170259-Pyramimonas_sp.AAC.1
MQGGAVPLVAAVDVRAQIHQHPHLEGGVVGFRGTLGGTRLPTSNRRSRRQRRLATSRSELISLLHRARHEH